MNLADLLQMTKAPQAQAQQSEGLGPIMQFLSMHGQQQQLPQMQFPMEAPGADAIMSAAMQKKAQKDQYAAHLQAKNDMEMQQAQAISGHEGELSDNPQVQAMLKSGNPQLVAYAMKIAEDEQQKKIAAQYGENPTFAKYQDALKNAPAKAAQMLEWIKLKTPATNIYTDSMKPPMGYRWNGDDHTSVLPLTGGPEDKAAQPLTESQAKAMSNLKVMEETSKQYDEFMQRTGYDPTKMTSKDSLAQGLISIDSPIADMFGITPSIEAQGRSMASPQALEYFTTVGRWNEIFGRDKSGGAIKNPEYRAWLMQYWPGPHDTPEIVANKTKARKAYEQSLMLTANPENRQQTSVNPILAQAAERLGVPLNHPIMPLAGAIANQESGGRANIHDSVDGAQGIMQVMPDTFRQMNPNGNIRNPVDNAQAGLSYLLQNWQDTGGSMQATAMRYHGGPKGDSRLNVKDGLGVSNARYGKEVVSRIRAQSPDGKAEAAKKEARIKELRAQAGLR